MGELVPVLPAAGYSVQTALTMATDVMAELISQRFNFKWNREKIPPFYTNSWQQDYAGFTSTWRMPMGWMEGAYWIDINNTALPKPTYPIEVVRDLVPSSISGNPPAKIAWYPNEELIYGTWPGPGKTYTQPLGAVITPTNPPVNILDAAGNILVLTTYGTTGTTAPAAPAASAEMITVNDGSCVWTVADPNSQGFRLLPLPPQQAVVYQVNVVAQMKAPPPFTSMQQQINPVPDDQASWFRSGYVAYCYRMSPNPQMRAMFPKMRELWLGALEGVLKQNDRETDSAGFYPDRTVIAPQGGWEIGPAWPYAGPGSFWPGR